MTGRRFKSWITDAKLRIYEVIEIGNSGIEPVVCSLATYAIR